jgi:hypothetical protein
LPFQKLVDYLSDGLSLEFGKASQLLLEAFRRRLNVAQVAILRHALQSFEITGKQPVEAYFVLFAEH